MLVRIYKICYNCYNMQAAFEYALEHDFMIYTTCEEAERYAAEQATPEERRLMIEAA